MIEETKAKKIRIYKFASEYNLSADSLVEFLRKKGYEVKSHMSPLTDEMLADVEDHFKKDIEKAEKHYRKVSEFQKKRGIEKPEDAKPKEEDTQSAQEEDAPAETEIETPAVQEDEKPVEEVQAEVEISPEHEVIESEIPQPEEEIVTGQIDEQTEEQPVVENPVEEAAETETSVNETQEPEVQAAEEKPKVESKFVTQSEKDLGKKGLTILGKIDLNKNKKSEKPAEEQEQQTGRKQTPHERLSKRNADDRKTEVPQGKSTTQTPVNESAEEAERKKKKKKPKPKKKTKGEQIQEEAAIKRKKIKRVEVDKRDVDEAIKRTMLSLEDSGVSDRASARKKRKKERQEIQEKKLEQQLIDSTKLKVTEFIAVSELANLMNVPVSEVITKCIGLGIMVSINQRLDVETITLVADEFGFEVEFEQEYTSEELEDTPDAPESLQSRPPVVTIMGHVDHGKTSLLDRIRQTNVVAGESGGITQHIGAYQVQLQSGKYITFLDTPGHEAFTAMRARGAKVTDIVVLIVAADDAVMPQTIEAINHAQAAGVPIVIAINKVDKPGANIEKIKQQLADRNVLVEDWGGKYQSVEVSAKAGLNIEELLDKILLEAEILELKANPDRMARGAIIETKLEKGRGVMGTILVEKGTLKVGDPFVAGVYHGRVRAMFDERNNKVDEAGPSAPVVVIGFEGAPQAGDTFVVVDSERTAREVAIKRQQLKREQDQRQVRHITLDEIARQISVGGVKELPLIVKGDVDGSVEALSDSLMKLSNQEVIVRVIHKGVGAISEGDVLLAAASQAIIIGFHVRPNINARKLAENEKVDIRLYSIIYDAINEVKSALEGLLSPIISEEITGSAEVRDTFKVPKVGTIAGCYVLEGRISRVNKVRIIRQGIVIFTGELDSLKRFKDDVKEVDAGYECGLNIHNFNDIKVGDIVEAFKFIETKKKLE